MPHVNFTRAGRESSVAGTAQHTTIRASRSYFFSFGARTLTLTAKGLIVIRMHFKTLLLLARGNGNYSVGRENHERGIDRMAKTHIRMRQVIHAGQENWEKRERNCLLAAMAGRQDETGPGKTRNDGVHENIRQS